MLALLVYLLATDGQVGAVRIETAEPREELRVKLQAGGWSRACPVPVIVNRPCEVTGVPAGVVQLAVSGSRSFDASVLLQASPSVVRLEREGHGRGLAGLGLVAAAVALIAAGVNAAEGGDRDGAEALVGLGVTVEIVGIGLIISDLTRPHDRAVVVD